jgi:hypothetical protein
MPIAGKRIAQVALDHVFLGNFAASIRMRAVNNHLSSFLWFQVEFERKV